MEAAGFLLALAGASLAAALGRSLVALLLAALALGMGRRIIGRQKRAAKLAPRVPTWVHAGSLALSLVEVAALFEATDTPIRFGQEGSSHGHWALALAAVAVAYLAQARVLAALSRRFCRPGP